jgi:general transcription factor 3C polypeptide 3 (transcription factor C subunit 4)
MAESKPLRSIAPKTTQATTLMAAPLAPGKGRAQPGEGTRTDDIQFLYAKLLELNPQVKDGVSVAIEDWLDIADALLRDFRNNRAFYPMDRSIAFRGYSTGVKHKNQTKNGTMMDEMQQMAGRLQETLGMSPGYSIHTHHANAIFRRRRGGALAGRHSHRLPWNSV